MKRFSTILIAALTAFTLACGYSSKATTPPTAGTTPTIAALAPNSVKAGTTGNSFMVTGTNFNSNAAVNWNGAALATTFTSASLVTAAVPDADVATTGTASVTVTNPGTAGTGAYGSGGTSAETSSPMTFTIN
jgi:hypothetical protein